VGLGLKFERIGELGKMKEIGIGRDDGN